jgi:ABC-2 type transport system ATP-binding protein
MIGELGRICDRVVVLDHGRLVADTTPDELVESHDRGILVRAADEPALAAVLRAAGATVRGGGGLTVHGIGARRIGELACAHRIPVRELTPRRLSLEDAFLRMTGGARAGRGAS